MLVHSGYTASLVGSDDGATHWAALLSIASVKSLM